MSETRGYYPASNQPCDETDRREAHGPHEWNDSLGDEGYECWGYPIPAEQPEQFRVYRKG